MKLQDIVLKDAATPLANVTFAVACQEGLKSQYSTSRAAYAAEIVYNFRRERKGNQPVSGKATATINVTVPAQIDANGRILVPEQSALVRMEILTGPQMSVDHRKDVLAFAAGIAAEPMLIDAVVNGRVPY